jgi:hypothetical protein
MFLLLPVSQLALRVPFAIGGELSAISLRRRFVGASRKSCCTAIMKRLTSKNWRAKLISVLLRDNALVPDQKERSDDVLAV